MVREDPARRGLLYAGTETGVFVSFNDGAQWQPLQLNLPTMPIRDLVIPRSRSGGATHGRSFWILDDVTPLRKRPSKSQIPERILLQAGSCVARAARLGRRDAFPAEIPAGENPPDGAID